MGAVLELPTKQHCQSSPFTLKMGHLAGVQNGPQNFDFFFSIAMDADYSFELNFTETYAPPFCGHNKLFLGG